MVSALEAWGGILDRSIEEIAAASEGSFDGRVVRWIAEAWHNNVLGFVGAVLVRSPRRRERLAEAGLVWMADFGAERRSWALQIADEVGYELRLPDLTVEHQHAVDRPERGVVTGVPRLAAELLYQAVIEIRMVGSFAMKGRLDEGGSTPVPALCLALAGAGEEIIAAGSSWIRRDAAFGAMITGWVRANDEARLWFLEELRRIAGSETDPLDVRTAAAEIARVVG